MRTDSLKVAVRSFRDTCPSSKIRLKAILLRKFIPLRLSISNFIFPFKFLLLRASDLRKFTKIEFSLKISFKSI